MFLAWGRLCLNLNEALRKKQAWQVFDLGFEHLICSLYRKVIYAFLLLLKAIKKRENYLYSGSNQACTEKQNCFYDK